MRNIKDHWLIALIAFIVVLTIVQVALMVRKSAERAGIQGRGKGHQVVCYSGNTLIYEGTSTGRVHTMNYSKGFHFTDKATNTMMTVSGNCVITQASMEAE